ncbi:HD domain-containing protein [Halobacteriovorax sp. GB3]|uniref:HD-GYP domain-containing protein n=1 Tax=Halobacteriovorax sp. GB3 TaxID=2719615 RepID=UPI00236252A1|nr:HD domain-containing phosphohydrolase [Halobacteriovorax sp. GB3]MDD0851453.1 HD domain-containing protein [Halobacteriovorax sp. GB3]
MNEQTKTDKHSFFSVSFDLILLNDDLPYDLFINSSALENRERFVKVHSSGNPVSNDDLTKFKGKFHQLYVLEEQRDLYLRSLAKLHNVPDTKKTEVIKDSAIGYLNKLFDPSKAFTTEILNEVVEGCRDSVEGMVDVIQDYGVGEVRNLIADLSFHDFYTYDHSINVSMYCISLLKALKPKVTREEMVLAGLGGLLHDLGKVQISTTILNSADGLTDEEFAIIKRHPGFGKDMIEKGDVNVDGIDFNVIRRVVFEHHENYNGTGYPNRLEGEQIHILARICAIADFFDAITTKRSYHEALSMEDALAVMERSSGRKIDPNLFEAFKTKVTNVVYKGKSNHELPDSFDPCMPHKVLPLEKVQAKKMNHDLFKKDKNEFGEVKVDKKDAA